MQDFETLRAVGDSLNEHNDCAVIAVAAATGTPYETVHALMKKLGRRTRGRTYFNVIEGAIKALGFEMIRESKVWLIHSYHPGYKNITMNHFTMYPRVYKHHTWLVTVSGGAHIAAVVNGKVEDWSVGRKLRVHNIWKVVKA